jgi:prepilin signal peptidase PulO-like enzyme (type II secretory pathway)
MYSLLFLFGLLVGSLLNVLALRYKENGKIFEADRVTGRSRCPYCKKTLGALELIPFLSYVFQLGKCKSCKKKLSIQYPVVELVTGLATAFTVWALQTSYPFNLSAGFSFGIEITFIALWLLVIYSLILITLIDLRLQIIPDRVNIFLLILGLGLLLLKSFYPASFPLNGTFLGAYAQIINPASNIWLNALLAAGFGFVFFGLIIAFTRGKGMGMGDLKLIVPLAIILGWPDILLMVSMSFIIGTILTLPMLILKRKAFKSAVPFGPFLVLSFFVTIMWGQEIVSWYFSLL